MPAIFSIRQPSHVKHKEMKPKSAEDQLGLHIKHSRVFSVLQAGFPNTMQKHDSQFPGFCSLWSLAEKNKVCGNISDAISDAFDAR